MSRRRPRSRPRPIEHRVERSFADDRMNAALLGSDIGAEIFRTLRAAMILEALTPAWDGDLAKAERFRTVANAVIADFLKLPIDLPPPEKRLEDMQTAKELLLRFSPRHVELPPEIMFSDLEELDWSEAAEEEPKTSKRRKAGT